MWWADSLIRVKPHVRDTAQSSAAAAAAAAFAGGIPAAPRPQSPAPGVRRRREGPQREVRNRKKAPQQEGP